MDTPRFDGFARRVSVRLTRRTGLGLLSGVSLSLLGIAGDTQSKQKKVTLCFNGQTVRRPKKKAKKLEKSGATRGACVNGCGNNQKRCNNTCIPSGGCCVSSDCPGGNICENGTCAPPRCGNGGTCTVFVTADGFKGSEVGGIAGGDARCQAAAVTANRTGTYKAWLSFGSDTPGSRFTKVAQAGPYRLVPNGSDGANPPPLVARDLADVLNCPGFLSCLENPINRDEDGQPVPGGTLAWTGTMPNGVSAAYTCAGWTNGDNATGLTGDTEFPDTRWTNNGASLCDQSRRLYCFQQAT